MTVSRPLQILLWPASLLYGAGVRIRTRLYASGFLKQKCLKAAVISVGNLSVGGTGKTPFVIWLAEKLLTQGKRVAILTRGYRGVGGTSDEVELIRSRLQNRVLFGVGRDRYKQGRQLESQQPIDVFILDDGFQHLQLARDLDIVLLDASRPIGRQPLLPAGRMREPLSSIARAGTLVFTRLEDTAAKEAIQRLWKLPIFVASTHLLGFRCLGTHDSLQSPAELGAGPFFAFCGIGNPEAFVRDLIRWGIAPAGQMFFADHHRYTRQDVRIIEQAALQAGGKALLTTEKDFWNFRDVSFASLPVYVSVIDLEIAGEDEFLGAVNLGLVARGGRT